MIISSNPLSVSLAPEGGPSRCADLGVRALLDGGIDIGMTHTDIAGSVRFTISLGLDDAAALHAWLTQHLTTKARSRDDD